MANYAALKATIDADIRSNGEQLITGPVLNGILTNILAEMGQAGFLFKGMAHPGDTPAASDSNLFYLAVEAGQYSGFDGRTVTAGQLVIFAWDGTWASDVLLDISGKANKNGDPAEAFTVFTLTAISNIVGQTVVGKTVAGDKVTVHNDDNNATTDLVPGGQSEDIEVAMPSKDGTLALQEDVDEAVSQLGQEVNVLDANVNGGAVSENIPSTTTTGYMYIISNSVLGIAVNSSTKYTPFGGDTSSPVGIDISGYVGKTLDIAVSGTPNSGSTRATAITTEGTSVLASTLEKFYTLGADGYYHYSVVIPTGAKYLYWSMTGCSLVSIKVSESVVGQVKNWHS